jgi:hypothetical protein
MRPGGGNIIGNMTGVRPGGISGLPGGISGRPGTIPGIQPGTAAGGRTFPGGNFMGTRPPQTIRTAPQVRAQLRELLPNKPVRVFEQLRGDDGRILGQAGKIALAREAFVRIAEGAETTSKPVEGLVEARSARSQASRLPDLPADVRAGLERVAQGLERRVLVERLHEVGLAAERGQWAEVAQKARQGLGELNDPRLSQAGAQDSAEFRVGRVEVKQLLGEAGALAERMAALGHVETALKGLDPAKPGESARALGKVDQANLPAALRRQTEALRGLAELKEAMGQKWARAPDVAGLKQSVARLERGLADLPGADASLGKQVLQDLAVKAVLEGHAAEALKLLPEGGPAEHAGNLLRDLKALALGEGKVETAPAQAALGEPGKGPAGARPPPGLEPLIPEGARESWRPPVKESAKADLPPMQQAEKAGAAVREKVEKGLPAQRSALEKEATQTRQKISTTWNRVMAPERAERRQLAAVENELDRKLKPPERVKARLLLNQNTPPAQVAATLRAQPGGDDEETEFLADVQKRLGGRPLAADQKAQAKRLRKQGRIAAEVADILR